MGMRRFKTCLLPISSANLVPEHNILQPYERAVAPPHWPYSVSQKISGVELSMLQVRYVSVLLERAGRLQQRDASSRWRPPVRTWCRVPATGRQRHDRWP
jgi:hypothetical protein